jgi:hypothetical protein
MRTTLVAFAMVSLVRACGVGPEEATPVSVSATAAPPAATFALDATHGGSVLQVEDQWVEVVPKSDGAIEAYVVESNGAALATPMTTTLTVKVTGDDGEQHDVVLPWNGASGRFEGRLERARPVPGPIEVVVVAPGRPPRRARSPIVVVAPAPPTAVVTHAAPQPVVVQPPQPPGVVVVAPQPPQPVVVEPPRPGVVIVEERRGRRRGHGRGRGRGEVIVAPDPRPTVVVAPPRPGVVVVAPPRPGAVVVSPGRPGAVVVSPGRGGPGRGGRGRGDDDRGRRGRGRD